MKFAMHIPLGNITAGEFQSAAAIRQMSQTLEAASVDACFVTDHPAPSAEGCPPPSIWGEQWQSSATRSSRR